MSTLLQQHIANLTKEIEKLRDANERLRRENTAFRRTLTLRHGVTTLDDAPKEYTRTFPFEWPSLKNTKQLITNSRTGKMAMRTDPNVKKAVRAIRDDLRLEIGDRELPLFGENDVGRLLDWNPDAKEITATWWDLGPYGKKQTGRRRDLVNLAALLDDAVGRERIGKKLHGPGLIYRDDAQIAEAFETRRSKL